MNNRKLTLAILSAMLTVSFGAQAQTKSLASTMEVFVFPKEGQNAEQQSKDEAACYEWAVSNTGTDPFKLADQQAADQRDDGRGDRERRSVRAR